MNNLKVVNGPTSKVNSHICDLKPIRHHEGHIHRRLARAAEWHALKANQVRQGGGQENQGEEVPDRARSRHDQTALLQLLLQLAEVLLCRAGTE